MTSILVTSSVVVLFECKSMLEVGYSIYAERQKIHCVNGNATKLNLILLVYMQLHIHVHRLYTSQR